MGKPPLPTEQGPSPAQSDVRNEYESSERDAPPAYSGPPTLPDRPIPAAPGRIPAQVLTSPRAFGLPAINFAAYWIPGAQLSEDETIRTTYLPSLSSDPNALIKMLRQQAALPPCPTIRIKGTHKTHTSPSTDFDLKLNMIRYILPSGDGGGDTNAGAIRWNYMRLVGDGEMAFRGGTTEATTPTSSAVAASEGRDGLEAWAKRFCRDPSSLKTLTFTREVVHWDTSYLEGQIRNLIATTGYLGNVSVSFPTTHSKVVVHTPRKTNSFFAGLFAAIVETKRYEIVQAIWPYATLDTKDAVPGGAVRTCAVQSEDAWWREWKDTIRSAILAQKQGWVSIDDMMQVAMAGPVADTRDAKPRDWGADYT